MFQFRAFPSYGYLIHRTILRYCLSVFPHSEISGSSLICSSPKLFAACHVLHRLLMPRHSPCALISLTLKWFLPFSGSHLRIMQAQQIYTKLYLPFKSFHNAVLFTRFSPRPLLPCFFLSSLFSFQGANKDTKCTLKIEQCKNSEKADLGCYTRLVTS